MPISALPGDGGIGTLGTSAYRFIDFLKKADMSIWQILPLVPTNYGDSPYQSCSSLALNYYFIDLPTLVEQGLLMQEDVDAADLGGSSRRVDYGKLFNNKINLLRKAFARFDREQEDFRRFVKKGEYSDFAIFMSIKSHFNHIAWKEWPEPYRTYDAKVVKQYVKDNADDIEFWQFTQYIFLGQWKKLKQYAKKNHIEIMGDMPLYIAEDSVEFWKYGKELFQVDENNNPVVVAGVPPDCFSADGQLWGNPIYDWEKMKQDGFKWWNNRLKKSLKLFDILRIDHFRGFDRYYAINAGETTARYGVWRDGPKTELFKDKLDWNIVAEDLGTQDESLAQFMREVGYPGMKVLEFAFDGSPDNSHRPTFYTANSVAYTGTHDNMPLKQYIADLSQDQYNTFLRELYNEAHTLIETDFTDLDAVCDTVIRLGFACVSNTFIAPLSDILKLGGEARINEPSTVKTENWSYRFMEGDYDDALAQRLKELVVKYNRQPKK